MKDQSSDPSHHEWMLCHETTSYRVRGYVKWSQGKNPIKLSCLLESVDPQVPVGTGRDASWTRQAEQYADPAAEVVINLVLKFEIVFIYSYSLVH